MRINGQAVTCKISIITITLNADVFFRKSISSVVGQTYNHLEYIVVDGGSTDATLDIIKKYESDIDCWISEPDNGISQAMNKGLQLATGDYILFLHADDYLIEPRAIEIAANYFTDQHEIYIFPVMLDDGESQKKSHCNSLGWRTNLKMGSCHQGQFFSRKLLMQLGRFDESLSICMDYDMLLRAYRTGTVRSTTFTGFPVSVMRLGGISSRKDWSALLERFAEERTIHEKNCDSIWLAFFYKMWWSVYLPYRKLLYRMQPPP